MKNGIKLIGTNTASVRLGANLGSVAVSEATEKFLTLVGQLWYDQKRTSVRDNIHVPSYFETPREDQFVSVPFRALSQRYLANRGLDFSVPGVLEPAAAMLKGRTVYQNHQFTDVSDALGSFSDSWWDSEGKDSRGIPGINAIAKVDALLNYRIARLLTMDPPAIHSMSLTVYFEFEFSHPKLYEEGNFWKLLGEEVEGEIVRLIVTKIIKIFEGSLVWEGEDELAKQLPKEEETGEDEDENKTVDKTGSGQLSAPDQIEEDKMKLTKEQKEALGIDDQGEEIAESLVLEKALELKTQLSRTSLSATEVAELTDKAAIGDTLLEAKREEVKSLATVAELGGDPGQLNPVLEKTIASASAEDLLALEKHYRDKAAQKLMKSSAENSGEIEAAGGIANKAESIPEVGVV